MTLSFYHLIFPKTNCEQAGTTTCEPSNEEGNVTGIRHNWKRIIKRFFKAKTLTSLLILEFLL